MADASGPTIFGCSWTARPSRAWHGRNQSGGAPRARSVNQVTGGFRCRSLREIYRNRPAGERQFYLSLTPNIGNPEFAHEQPYASLKLPDAGYQLLALYRFWNIIEYWFPYRDVIGGNWDDELTTFIPWVASAATATKWSKRRSGTFSGPVRQLRTSSEWPGGEAK